MIAEIALTCVFAFVAPSTGTDIRVCIHTDGSVSYPAGSLDAASEAYWEQFAKKMFDDLNKDKCPPVAEAFCVKDGGIITQADQICSLCDRDKYASPQMLKELCGPPACVVK